MADLFENPAGLDGFEFIEFSAREKGQLEKVFEECRDNTGVIVLLTFGTGIGSAVIHNGVLLPNTEFGHLEVGGKEAEHRAASSVKERRMASNRSMPNCTRVINTPVR